MLTLIPPNGKLYTLGYAAPNAGERLQEIMQECGELATIVDIRQMPLSRWKPEWSKSTLERYWAFKYIWRGDLLGNINYQSREKGIEIAHPEQGIKWLVQFLQSGRSLILLCACKEYETCHRKVVVDLVKEQLPEVEVIA